MGISFEAIKKNTRLTDYEDCKEAVINVCTSLKKAGNVCTSPKKVFGIGEKSKEERNDILCMYFEQ